MLKDIIFAWRYYDPISTSLYKPAYVFKKFSFLHLLDPKSQCLCNTARRLKEFLDPNTLLEKTKFAPACAHVRTMDTKIVQHPELRQAIANGLNHIPIRPTNLGACIAVTLEAFEQLCDVLSLEQQDFPVADAREWIRNHTLGKLKNAKQKNLYGFRSSAKELLAIPAVTNEIEWLTDNLFCVGIDKAANNCSFICAKHIRLMALERLSSKDFQPCQDDEVWLLPTHILDKISGDLQNIIPELHNAYTALPYMMATFKQHKLKYRWLTNAHNTIFSGLAHLLTIATGPILESIKTWAAELATGYKNLLKVDTSVYWLVNSVVEAALNLPMQITDVYVADITRCYESIPLDGEDNLQDAIARLISIGFKQEQKNHPRAKVAVWIRFDSSGQAVRAVWATAAPTALAHGSWVPFQEDRLIRLHSWLMHNCYVALGDRVWRQISGIPMGFSCSPLWCNMYLLYYESQFIQRLARLGRADLLIKFRYAFRYIDDLCWINSGTPATFLSPEQERVPNNPFWIYPLNVLEIKCEVTRYDEQDPTRGVQAHFMNLGITVHDMTQGACNYRLAKFDKRRDLPFGYTQYIKFQSNRPVKQSYAVGVSQTVPILYLSNNLEDAANEIKILIATLANNGFQRSRLVNMITRFIRHNQFPGVKFDIHTLVQTIRYQIKPVVFKLIQLHGFRFNCYFYF